MAFIRNFVFSILTLLGLFYIKVVSQELVAAKSKSHLNSRSINLSPSFAETHLLYVDEKTLYSSSQFSARVKVTPKLPVLLLEDAEHFFSYIHCSEFSIDLGFRSRDDLYQAKAAWEESTIFALITSHAGCNADGAHNPYLVSSVSFNAESLVAVLSVVPLSWDEVSHSLSLDFGEGVHGHFSHDSLRRRRASPQMVPESTKESNDTARGSTADSNDSKQSSTATATQTSSTTTTSRRLNFPTPTGGSFNSTNSTADISKALTDVVILPPSARYLSLIPGFNDTFPPEIELICRNCSTFGTLSLSQNSISINTTNLSDLSISGYVNLNASGLGAIFELALNVNAGLGMWEQDIPLPVIPIAGFSIPGIARAGVTFEPLISLSMSLDAQLNLSTGFSLSVPSDSFITLDLSNHNATSQGFKDTTFTLLPLNASASLPALTLTAAFTPQVLVGITPTLRTPRASLSFHAGLTLSLPRLAITLAPLTSADAHCAPAPAASALPGTLLLISPSVELGVEAVGGFDLQVGVLATATEWASQVVKTTLPLPTQCLSFSRGGYAVATMPEVSEAVSKATAMPTPGAGNGLNFTVGAGGDKKAGAVRRVAGSTAALIAAMLLAMVL
ncbi:MAG: hypothetical protein M1829_000123 [Trizodia sp. TS-e1964]|nr:MAG: hypothetical protein M1829_000123 [Trizodia sp. TS-e1964]